MKKKIQYFYLYFSGASQGAWNFPELRIFKQEKMKDYYNMDVIISFNFQDSKCKREGMEYPYAGKFESWSNKPYEGLKFLSKLKLFSEGSSCIDFRNLIRTLNKKGIKRGVFTGDFRDQIILKKNASFAEKEALK